MATSRALIPRESRQLVDVRDQRGSASIEFVLLFPALFLIFYAIVSYGLMFGAQHALTRAAAEGGRAALRYQRVPPGATDALAAASLLRATAAQSAANAALGWLIDLHPQAVIVPLPAPQPCADAPTLTCLTVLVTYDYQSSPLVPRLLPAPSQLSSQAVVQLSPMQLL